MLISAISSRISRVGIFYLSLGQMETVTCIFEGETSFMEIDCQICRYFTVKTTLYGNTFRVVTLKGQVSGYGTLHLSHLTVLMWKKIPLHEIIICFTVLCK